MQTQYYAGWDGGGTKTLCRVLYQDGTAPQPFTAGALNPNGTVAGQCEATVADLLAEPGKLAQMGQNARKLSVDDSLDRIANALLQLVKTP